MIKQVLKFEARDGELFPTEELAQVHETVLDLLEGIARVPEHELAYKGRHRDSTEVLFDWVVRHYEIKARPLPITHRG